jgi:hypothetical protein
LLPTATDMICSAQKATLPGVDQRLCLSTCKWMISVLEITATYRNSRWAVTSWMMQDILQSGLPKNRIHINTFICIRWDFPTVALRVVRGDWKGTQCPGVYLGHPVPGGYKYGDLALQVGGVSRIGTIKYGFGFRGAQTRVGLRCRGPAATVNYRPVLSSERALQNNKPGTV